MVRLALFLLLAWTCAPMAAEATILRVPSEYWSIRTAVYAATEGDTILVAPGTYRGSHNRAISFGGKNLTLRSEAGASVTAIDCEGQDRAFNFNNGEDAAVVEGFTITGGYAQHGGALRCTGSAPRFVSCAFEWNNAIYTGGAIECISGSSLVMSRCSFKRNMPEEWGAHGGAVNLLQSAAVFDECTFVLNYAYQGAGIYADLSTVELTDCVFVDNSIVGGVYTTQSAVTLRGCLAFRNFGGGFTSDSDTSVSILGCTFSENYSRGIALSGESAPEIANTIIAFTHPDVGSGRAVLCYGGVTPALSCCDLYGNAGGDWTDCVAGMQGTDGNICQDPLFCGGTIPEEAHSLDASSPCAPGANPECGLIGALDVGCGFTVAKPISWGRLKGLFRD